MTGLLSASRAPVSQDAFVPGGRLLAVVAIAASILAFGETDSSAEPPNIAAPVVINLTLPARKWRVGDRLWYTLEFKNVGNESIWIGDEFWREHKAQPENPVQGTFFEVIGPKGKKLKPFVAWGQHGEFRFWGTDVSSFSMRVEPGQSVFAAPSVVAPIRPQTGTGPADFRAGPPGSPPGEYEQRLRKIFAAKKSPPCENLDIPEGRPSWAPTNGRILEDYCLRSPGRYKIRAVYAPVRADWAERQSKAGHSVGGFPKSTRVFRYESEWLQFEVSP